LRRLRYTLIPYTTLFRSDRGKLDDDGALGLEEGAEDPRLPARPRHDDPPAGKRPPGPHRARSLRAGPRGGPSLGAAGGAELPRGPAEADDRTTSSANPESARRWS